MTKTQRKNTILEEDLQSIGLDDQEGAGGRWDTNKFNSPFDFTFLKRQRKREKIKLIACGLLVSMLLVVVVVVGVSYQKERIKNKQLSQNKSPNLEHSKCLPNEKEKQFCICEPKFVKDEDGICRDINFVLNFKKSEMKRRVFSNNLVKLTSPKNVNEINSNKTICLWSKASSNEGTLLHLRAVDSAKRQELKLVISNNQYNLTINSKDKQILYYDDAIITKDTWTHLCYQFQKNNLSVFVNGTQYIGSGNGRSSQYNSSSSSGEIATVSVGGDGFVGGLTNVFVYSKILTGKEIMDSFQNRQPLGKVIVGWWSFVLS